MVLASQPQLAESDLGRQDVQIPLEFVSDFVLDHEVPLFEQFVVGVLLVFGHEHGLVLALVAEFVDSGGFVEDAVGQAGSLDSLLDHRLSQDVLLVHLAL